MKKAMLILLALAVVTMAHAQSGFGRQRTFGQSNGHFWNDVDDSARLYYLMGFQDGNCVTSTGSRMTLGDLEKGLTQFYVDAANIRIPVANAIEIFKMKFGGEAPGKIEAEVARIRKKADSQRTDTEDRK